MSQFDFPRINFHGSATLDTATANNGYYEPFLTVFDQDDSEVFMPPRIYLPPGNSGSCQPPPGVPVRTDKEGNSYVPIIPINADNYQQWATTPLGSFAADAAFHPLYQCVNQYILENLANGTPVGNPILGACPGYWNYFGDLSMNLENVVVTGITLTGADSLPVIYTPENLAECPEDISVLMGAELSFKKDHFVAGARTSAFLSDVDSIGQMCTQIFCGNAGLYKKVNNTPVTFFQGKPSKSTARFMNLTRTLNQTNLVPMGGSASFYAAIPIDTDSYLSKLISPYAGQQIDSVFLKILIHEVYEVRHPSYALMPVQTLVNVSGEQIKIPKNPARVTITGSITPWYPGKDMKTISVSRIMKNSIPGLNPVTVNIDTSQMIDPIPVGSSTPIGIPDQVNLAPVPFVVNSTLNLISLDLSNMLHEYGTSPGPIPSYAGDGDIAPFQDFINYDYGNFSLMFQPDGGGTPNTLGTIAYSNYEMQQFIANAGMVDLELPAGDYTNGFFYLSLNGSTVLTEDDYFISSDQNGIYAEQNDQNSGLYLSDGLPKVPFVLRVFFRGLPVSSQNPAQVTLQSINLVTGEFSKGIDLTVYDGFPYVFPVSEDGCLTYVFGNDPSEFFPPQLPGFAGIALFAMNAQLVVLRVLSVEPQLAPYLKHKLPVTWPVVFNLVLQLYKTIYPIMDKVLPINETTWSDHFIQSKIRELISLDGWNQPYYMPVTRDLSAAQRKLILMWMQETQSQQTKK